MCSLGSGCDIFFIEFQGSTIKCSYIPHTALKQHNMMDFITYSGSEDKVMYVLQCMQGMEKGLVENTDWFTHYKDDWEEVFSCDQDPSQTIVEETNSPMMFDSKYHGQQFLSQVSCNAPNFTYQLEKNVMMVVS